MKRRGFLAALGVVGAAAIAPTATAVAAVLPTKPLKPFRPSHPDFGKEHSMLRGKDFRDLVETVDALVEHVSR